MTIRSVSGAARSRRGLLRAALPVLTAAAAVLAGCATAPPAPPAPAAPVAPGGAAPALLAHVDSVVRQSDAARTVALEALPPQLAAGQPMRLNVVSAAPGYVYVFQLGSSGQLSMVFPNSVDGTNAATPGQALSLPRANWSMTARGPAGLNYVLAVVADKPQDLLALQRALEEQRIAIDGSYGAAMVVIRQVGN